MRKLRKCALLSVIVIGALSALKTNSLEASESTGKDLHLGTSNIANPEKPFGGNESTWKGRYVYYGVFDGEPVKYRVLARESEDFGAASMLINSDTIVSCDNTIFDDNSNVWSESLICEYLNGEFADSSLTEGEKNALIESVKSEAAEDDGNGWTELSYAPLTGQKIFLLDAVEATRESYGYTDHNWQSADRLKNLGDCKIWWLRSPYKYSNVQTCIVYTDGYLYARMVTMEDIGISPAMNIALDKILFNEYLGDRIYKLTLVDEALSLETSDTGVYRAGNTITVPVNPQVTDDKYVLVTDKPWNESGAAIISYLKTEVTNDGDTVSFELPSTYGEGKYLYVFAWQMNESGYSDYASEPLLITVPDEDAAYEKPTEAETASWTVESETTYRIKSDDGGDGGRAGLIVIALALVAAVVLAVKSRGRKKQ